MNPSSVTFIEFNISFIIKNCKFPVKPTNYSSAGINLIYVLMNLRPRKHFNSFDGSTTAAVVSCNCAYLSELPQALMSWTISLCRNPSTVASFTLAIVSPAHTHENKTMRVLTNSHQDTLHTAMASINRSLFDSKIGTHVQRKCERLCIVQSWRMVCHWPAECERKHVFFPSTC